MSPPARDRNCASSWLPLIQAAGLPTPDTRIVTGPGDLWRLLDGGPPTAGSSS